MELGVSVTRQERGPGPGQGNQSRAEGLGQEGPASREGLASPPSVEQQRVQSRGWQRLALPPEPQLHARLGHDGPLPSRVPGWAPAGLLAARSRPGGLVARGPLCPGPRWLHFSRPSSPQSGPCMGLITPGAENEAPQAAHEASL